MYIICVGKNNGERYKNDKFAAIIHTTSTGMALCDKNDLIGFKTNSISLLLVLPKN